MNDAGLDNPFWAALNSRHRGVAVRAGEVAARYPANLAPFLGVADDSTPTDAALAELVAADETWLALGVRPQLGSGWRVHAFPPLAQMVRERPLPPLAGADIVALDARHRADVRALTALVYPHYFRERTMELGRYFGIFQQGRLAAMIGERLGTDQATELSAICTHPDFVGQGHARRLTTFLCNELLARGRLPFLHVSYENARAKALYERMGFVRRGDLGFWSLTRA